MATRTDVRTDIDTLTGTDPQLSDAEINTLLQLRYENLFEIFVWPKTLREFVITTLAQVKSTATTLATATLDSATVTFAGTPITTAMNGAQIQIGAEPQYFFINRVSSSNITLENGEAASVTWPRATNASATWRVFKTIYTTGATGDTILTLAGQYPIDELSGGRPALDQMDAERTVTAVDPLYWLYAGVDSTTVREVELWPVPTQARILRGQMGRSPATLADATVIDVPRSLVVFSTAADCLNMLHSKTGDVSYKDLALFYERKYIETYKDVAPRELGKLSLPTEIRRGPRGIGSDFYVDHHAPWEG